MIRAHLAPIDLAMLAAYFGVTLIVGFWRRNRSTSDYLIASRSLGTLVFVATLVATWYGGILAVGEFTYDSGLANWTTQGLPYYVFALVFAFVMAPRVRSAELLTIPDKLDREYGRPAALLGAVFTFVLSSPAPYVLMVGQLTAICLGWPLLPAMIAGTLFSIAYVYVGGFESDVRINVFQFALMFAGFAVALPVLGMRLGGPAWLVHHVPPTHLTLTGGMDASYIVVWFFIALWTFVDPGFHQRCYAARSPRVAQMGIVLAVMCWAVFDFLTTTTGLYARAAMPNLPPGTHGLAFPLLAERFLPPGVRGLFMIAMLSTVMSTVVSYTFLGAMTIGRDVIWRMRRDPDDERVPRYARLGLVVSACFAIALCMMVPSVVRQWYALGTVMVPGLLLPVLGCYFPRVRPTPATATASMVAGSCVALGCLLAGWTAHGLYADTVDFPLHLQPMYPGLAASIATVAAGRLLHGVRRAAR